MSKLEDPLSLNEEQWTPYLHEDAADWARDMCSETAPVRYNNRQFQNLDNDLEINSIYAFYMNLEETRNIKQQDCGETVPRVIEVEPSKIYLIPCISGEEIQLVCKIGQNWRGAPITDYEIKPSFIRVITVNSLDYFKRMPIIARTNRPFILVLRRLTSVYIRFFPPDHHLTSEDYSMNISFQQVTAQGREKVHYPNPFDAILAQNRIQKGKNKNYCYIYFTFKGSIETGRWTSWKSKPASIFTPEARRTITPENPITSLTAEEWRDYTRDEAKEWAYDMCKEDVGILENVQFTNFHLNMETMSLYAFCLKLGKSKEIKVENVNKLGYRTVEVEPGCSYLILCGFFEVVTVKCVRGDLADSVFDFENKSALVRVIARLRYEEFETFPVIIRSKRLVTLVIKQRRSVRIILVPPGHSTTDESLKEITFDAVNVPTEKSAIKSKGLQGYDIFCKLPYIKYWNTASCYITFIPGDNMIPRVTGKATSTISSSQQLDHPSTSAAASGQIEAYISEPSTSSKRLEEQPGIHSTEPSTSSLVTRGEIGKESSDTITYYEDQQEDPSVPFQGMEHHESLEREESSQKRFKKS